jgi:thiamine kinase-like enzyme
MSVVDVAHLLGRVAVASSRLGIAACRGGGSRVPRDPSGVTPEWLTQALGESGVDVEVNRVQLEEGHSGTTTRAWLAVDYRVNAESTFPSRYFLKVAPGSFGTAVFGEILGLGCNEIRFYDDLAAEVPVDVPRAYVARYERRSGLFVLALEDLAAADVVFRGFDELCELDSASSVVIELAKLHAAYWNSSRFQGDLAWLPAAGNDPAYRLGKALSELSARPALAKLAGRISEDFARRAVGLHRKRDALERAWAEPPLTLVHGDAHLGNLYFRNGRPGFFDWQIVSVRQGMRDVAHFLLGALAVADRRRWERDLIALYVDNLSQLGVVDLGFDQAWRQYRLHAFYEWFGLTVTVAGELQPKNVQAAVLERAVAAIEDLESMDLIEALA